MAVFIACGKRILKQIALFLVSYKCLRALTRVILDHAGELGLETAAFFVQRCIMLEKERWKLNECYCLLHVSSDSALGSVGM